MSGDCTVDRITRSLLLALLLSLCVGIRAQTVDDAPNNTDLHAAYCIPVVQSQLDIVVKNYPGIGTASQPADIPQLALSYWREYSDRVDHLRSYLMPRLQFVDPISLAAARKRGQTDEARLSDPQLSACSVKCLEGARDGKAVEACVRSCNPELFTRVWSCNDLSWLPF
jgi:hypothetical protein